MSMKTQEEITAELETLNDLKTRIPQRTVFGDANRAKIDAQIAVLDGSRRLSYYEPDETCEEYEESDTELYNEAEYAYNWAQGREAEAPSVGWAELVK